MIFFLHNIYLRWGGVFVIVVVGGCGICNDAVAAVVLCDNGKEGSEYFC